MYNPLPPGKMAHSGASRSAPKWQPLKPLKPIELQNAGFVQENYLRAKANTFALWTVDPAAWYEPLKRLALHLAEQLTLTELSISSAGIQNLIDRCIETLDVQTASSVVVELNPNDMALLQNHKAVPGEKMPTWRMVADTHLLPGSVRVRADDAVVSDLIEHRLETLAHALLEDTKPWQAQSAFQPERLSARRGKAETVEDALPREASPEPLNLSALDLPDLELGNDKPAQDDPAEDASHE